MSLSVHQSPALPHLPVGEPLEGVEGVRYDEVAVEGDGSKGHDGGGARQPTHESVRVTPCRRRAEGRMKWVAGWMDG